VCDPVSIIAGGLTVGSKIADHYGKKKAAKANKEAANADMRLQFSDVNARQVEETKAAAAQIAAGLKQKNDAQGTALAAAAGANVSGLSVDALLNTIEGDAASYTDSVRANLDMITDQLGRERRGILAGTAQRIQSVQAPSLLGTGLRIAGAGVDIYARHKASQPNNPRQK